MSDPCPCDQPLVLEPEIAAGLDALPRQLRTFPEVRRALLAAITQKPALRAWRARGGRDLGVMWLEMWAYVSDLLAFYDERIANETYLRTALRTPSLRRIVGLLGYVPTPGVGGGATLAAIAEGRKELRVPPGTAFRSDAFGASPPQVFETGVETPIHPFKNQWQIGAIKRGVLPQLTPSQAPGQRGATSPLVLGAFFVFDVAGLNLAKDQLALFEFSSGARSASKVKSVSNFTGKDGRNYAEIEFEPPIQVPSGGVLPSAVRVRTPTATATVSRHSLDASPSAPLRSDGSRSLVALDTVYRQLKVRDPVISAVDAATSYQPVLIDSVSETFAIQRPATKPDQEPQRVPVTTVRFDRLLSKTSEPSQVVFHFNFVDAGSVSTVPDDQISKTDLTRAGGLPISGLVETPPDAVPVNPFPTRELNQEFLIVDADERGAQVTGVLRFSAGGRATFQVLETTDLTLDSYKAPITIFGNLLGATRGESVFNESLGRGDARVQNQEFTLARKPLTYVFNPKTESGIASTLDVKVDLRSWTEVKSFFGRGSDERIFVVRRDDEQNTIIQFGDGVRGARVPSGAEVVANYRVGSGYDFPPAGAIAQISRPFVGLRSVRSPIAAEPGSNPDTAKTLRTHAPRSMLLFGRAVSVRDFETLANLTKGVIKAVAEFLWLEAEQSAGVQVTYIGDAKPEELTQRLRERAERNLTIRVEQAAGWVSELNIDVVHDSNFAAEVVARDVKQKLSHPETGILSRAQAEIGGQLWVSRIYQEVQSVAGVVNVQSIVLGVPSSSPLQIQRAAGATLSGVAASKFTVKKALWANNSVSRVLQALGRKDVVCTPPGTFLDFGEGTRVTVTSNSSVVVDLRTRRPTEEV